MIYRIMNWSWWYLLALIPLGYLVIFYLTRWLVGKTNIKKMVAAGQTFSAVAGTAAIAEMYRQKISDQEKEISELKEVISILGYNIHHLGHDIQYKREAIINTDSSALKEERGLMISIVGNVLRNAKYPEILSDQLGIDLKTAAKMFDKLTELGELPEGEEYDSLRDYIDKEC